MGQPIQGSALDRIARARRSRATASISGAASARATIALEELAELDGIQLASLVHCYPENKPCHGEVLARAAAWAAGVLAERDARHDGREPVMTGITFKPHRPG